MLYNGCGEKIRLDLARQLDRRPVITQGCPPCGCTGSVCTYNSYILVPIPPTLRRTYSARTLSLHATVGFLTL